MTAPVSRQRSTPSSISATASGVLLDDVSKADHRAAAAGRAPALRRDRQGRRPVRGGRPPAGAAAARRRRHADRRGHRPAARSGFPPGHGRASRRGRPRRRVADKLAAMPEVDYVVITRRLVRPARRARLRGRRRTCSSCSTTRSAPSRRPQHRDLRLPQAGQADLLLGDPMTTHRDPPRAPSIDQTPSAPAGRGHAPPVDALHPHVVLRRRTRCRSSCAARAPRSGTSTASATSTACPACSSSRSATAAHELAEAAARAGRRAGLLPAVELRAPERDRAGRAAGRPTPPATSTGSSSPPVAARPSRSAWKLARQYFKATGQPGRYKVISRDIAYHGTTMGALSITGLPAIKTPFEPLVPGAVEVPNTNFYRAPEHGDDLERVRRGGPPTRSSGAILLEGPEHGRRGLPRAGAELRRLLPAAARLLPAGARDLRPARRAAGLRRGHLRLRPARPLVRRRALRLPARHHHLRQGHDLGLLAPSAR